MKKFQTSLADKLAAAGLISANKLNEARMEKSSAIADEARTRLAEARTGGTIARITERYLLGITALSTVAETIEWAAAWYDELAQHGHEDALQKAGVEKCATCFGGCTEAEMSTVEEDLGPFTTAECS